MELDVTSAETRVATRLTLGCADPHGVGDADASFSDSVPRRRASFNISRMQPAGRVEVLRRPLPQINIPHVTLPRPILRAIVAPPTVEVRRIEDLCTRKFIVEYRKYVRRIRRMWHAAIKGDVHLARRIKPRTRGSRSRT